MDRTGTQWANAMSGHNVILDTITIAVTEFGVTFIVLGVAL